MKYLIKENIVIKVRKKLLCLMALTFFLISCDDFVDVDLPKDQLTSATVFNDAASATSALMNIYFEMEGSILSGVSTVSLGLYTDELDPSLDPENSSFYNHTITAVGDQWWGKAYDLIYETNAVIEGLESSTSIPIEDQEQLKGEALFLRGYIHFLMVNLYGPIPYITITDYIANSMVSRIPVENVYIHIINDLLEASDLLKEDVSGERIRAYDAVVDALLARVYLYIEDWEAAGISASKVISEFVLEPNLDKVFLKNSLGTIWQFKPKQEGENTLEAIQFIFIGAPGEKPILSQSLLDSFEFNGLFDRDQRKNKWVKSVLNGGDTWHHAYKYKEGGNTAIIDANGNEVATSFEYLIILRLAEQYLIRAEARARLGDIEGAQSDINVIRGRAGLGETTANTMEDLLDAILQERRVEFFTELGHRWFDLKRMGKAAEVLAPIKSNWRDTNVLFPVPANELLANPNLLPQNDGY